MPYNYYQEYSKGLSTKSSIRQLIEESDLRTYHTQTKNHIQKYICKGYIMRGILSSAIELKYIVRVEYFHFSRVVRKLHMEQLVPVFFSLPFNSVTVPTQGT